MRQKFSLLSSKKPRKRIEKGTSFEKMVERGRKKERERREKERKRE